MLKFLKNDKIFTERKKEHNLITALQAFGIILVVLGHSFDVEPSSKPAAYEIIYQFHMPLFIAISGFLLKYNSPFLHQISLPNFLKKRAVRLLIPYIVLSSFIFIPKSLLSEFALRPIHLGLMPYYHMLFYPDANVIRYLWFLPTLFLIMLFFVVLAKIIGRETNIITDLLLAIVLFFISDYRILNNCHFLSIDRVSYFLFFFFVGILICKYQRDLGELIDRKIAITWFSLLFLVLLFFVLYAYVPSSVYIAIVGVLASFMFFKLVTKNNSHLTKVISLYSYQIYLLSWFPHVFFTILYSHSHITHTPLLYYSFVSFSFLSGILAPLFVTFIVQLRVSSPFVRIPLGL